MSSPSPARSRVGQSAWRSRRRLAACVRKAIEQALERRAEREAKGIRVDVRDGAVTLTGTVHSWAERKSVVAAARFTPGVHAVEDRLRTEPGDGAEDVRPELE